MNVAICTESFAHKLLGNKSQTQLYLPLQSSTRWTLEGLKGEALDAFGLFDVSLGDGTDMQDDTEERITH